MFIHLENIFFTYSLGMPFETEVLKNINLEIDKGEFVGLIGHTGCGKTTLIQHFNGLLTPTSGKIYVEGVDLNKKGVNLRLVRQKIGLVFQYPENQLFEETIYQEVAFGPRKLGLPEGKIEKRVREALKMVDLHYNFGITVVLVSHNMEKVAETVKRLLVMHRGEIIIDDTPREIFEKHANDLVKVGLGLPQVTECMHKLKAKGKDVYTGVLTVDDAEREVLKKMKKPIKR